MRRIYIDKSYRCHTKSGGGRRAVDTSVFDGRVNEVIEGYCYIPVGETFELENGEVMTGECMFPFAEYSILDNIQRTNEQEALALLGLIGTEPPLDMALKLRQAVDALMSTVDDETALSVSALLPARDGAAASDVPMTV